MEKTVKNGVYTQVENGNKKEIAFCFSTNLSAKDKMKFVNNVTHLLVGDNYNGVIKDLIFDYEIINIFTDVDTTYIGESADTISAIEDLVMNTNIVEIVIANMEDGLIDILHKAVDDNIQYKTGIKVNPINDSLSSLLRTFEKKINGINVEEMMNFANAVSGISGQLTPEKILDAYSKTDMFTENQSIRVAEREKHNDKILEIASKK